jgi:exopolysaccharide production protein ExoQ
MPPPLALFFTAVFVVFLFRRDLRERPPVTRALWIPLLWLLIIGSRAISEWIGGGAIELTEGSPLDGAIYLLLQLAGLVVLLRRRISWSTFVSKNIWLVVFLGYAALSIFWSDYPFVSFKRWGKVLGHPIMVLIVATEPDPREALKVLLKRAAYVLVPFSITLIKWYADLGRGFDPFTGAAVNTGITTNKNTLGQDCLILGFFFAWHLLTTLRREKGRERSRELALSAMFLGMIGWLLYMAQSTTSTTTLAVGIFIVLFLGFRFVDKRQVGAYLVAGALLFGGAWIFGLSDSVINALGKDATMTGRTDLWEDVFRFKINPVIGAGFESFWLGDRLKVLWAKHWWRPNQAHNGYIETYLNLGWIGVILLTAWILSAFRKACRSLLVDWDWGRFRIAFVVIVVLVNFTEATFKALHPLWFMFYIVAMDYPRHESRTGSPDNPTPAGKKNTLMQKFDRTNGR